MTALEIHSGSAEEEPKDKEPEDPDTAQLLHDALRHWFPGTTMNQPDEQHIEIDTHAEENGAPEGQGPSDPSSP